MNLSPSEVGLLFTLFSLGGALAYLPAGILADQVSHRGRLLVATFWWVCLGYWLAAMAPGYWSLALLLALAGMGNAAWHPIATAVLTKNSRHQRAEALGIHAIGGSLAEVFAPLTVGFLLAHLDWRDALVISTLPAMLMGICFIGLANRIPRAEKKSVKKQDLLDLVKFWCRGKGILMVTMICLYNMALIALFSMIPLYLVDEHRFEPGSVGIAFSCLLVAGALAQPLVGKISDRIGRRPVVVSGCVIAALASSMLIALPSVWIVITALTISVAALDSIRAAILAGTVDYSRGSEGATLGFAFALLDGIGALGAVLAGFAAGISWSLMFGLVSALSICAATLAFVTAFGNPVTPLPLKHPRS